MMDEVRAWQETVVIPTYPVGLPDKNPFFLEKRVYQGSSGAVYPYPVIERVYDDREERAWTALFLENRYLKIMILPELGGRLQMALDKSNGYHFVYFNRVIKPALVGLTGPWISGGVEFNWPQHHRPSTFAPVRWRVEEHADGSKTIWCAELEIMFNTKGLHGFRLYPERAYLEVHVQLYNRTSEPQTFLWWANPAVHVNDDYQSVFPPDVRAVMDHGKRAVSDFPIATGTYYKVNYAPGTDISRYKNIPVPTSYMAYYSDFDFLGSYDHGRQAGMIHVANHHLVPGKKQWTWGCGDFGQAWDRQLTDEDGPYIELMCGAYTDNQPDFSWLAPGEEKRFTQTFLPYKLIGPAKNATQDAVVNLDVEGDDALIGVYVTRPASVRVILLRRNNMVFERVVDLSPERVFCERVTVLESNALRRSGGQHVRNILSPHELTLQVFEGQTRLIEFTPLAEGAAEVPTPAAPAPRPQEIDSNEELYLNGLHLEQYRHASYAPEPYYQEALRRDPLDSRCNNALGLLLLRRGQFVAAERCFRTAIKSLTRRNPNPYDGEPFYNLGLALKWQGRHDEAADAFYKATWNAAWQDAAWFELARLAVRAGRPDEALELTERSLRRNWMHHQARHLKIALLRRLHRVEEALSEAESALALDSMEFGALHELGLLGRADLLAQAGGLSANIAIELALDYAAAGLFTEAVQLLADEPVFASTPLFETPPHGPFIQPLPPRRDPLRFYYRAWVHSQAGDTQAALADAHTAASCSPAYCFPNRLESILALETARQINPQDARAPFLLGNFWYAHRRHDEAIACWETARSLDGTLATVHRNLGLAYYNQRRDAQAALAAYETAFTLDTSDSRVFFELDQLYKRLNDPPESRLARLMTYAGLTAQRDDLVIEQVNLLNVLGRHEEAFTLLMTRRFHPWEGGEGKTTSQYVVCLVEQAKGLLAQGNVVDAIYLLERAQVYPHSLGEGKLYGAQENHIFYWLGCAHALLEEFSRAAQAFERASAGASELTSPRYYNDQPPEMVFYQGLAHWKLGRNAEATAIFTKMVDYGRSHLDDEIAIDYFAVSLPDFLVFHEEASLGNRIHCHYMMGLGFLGLAHMTRAEETLKWKGQANEQFAHVRRLRRDHLGAAIHERMAAAI